MALTLQSAHQIKRAVVIEITGTSVSTTTASNPLAQLPNGAIVTGGALIVTTAFDASRTADIGDTTDPDRYTATPIALDATGRTALTLTGFKHTATENLFLELAGGAATVGAALLELEYVIVGASDFVQG